LADFWVSPARFRYIRNEIIWAIEVVLPLEPGQWPPEVRETGYEGHNKQRSNHAPYEASCLITSEVLSRLERTGGDGETLVWEVQHGLNNYNLLSPRARTAVNYVSGWRRRRLGYQAWLKQRRYRKK